MTILEKNRGGRDVRSSPYVCNDITLHSTRIHQIDQIKALCEKDREALDLIDQELTRKRGGNNNPYGCKGKDDGINADNISNDSKRNESHGTSIEYTLRRLRKDHPET